MKTNIAIISPNIKAIKSACKNLSDKLDMIFADVNDILEYNMVNQHMLEVAGKDYFDKEETKVLASVIGCNNTCLCCSFDILNKKNNFELIKSNCLVIFLKINNQDLFFSDTWQKQTYALDVENKICEKYADIIVETSKNQDVLKEKFKKNNIVLQQ